MNVVLTAPALHDLENIRAYLAEHSPQGRESVMTDIQEILHSFESGLVRGRPTPRDDIFERITRKYSYLLPYTVRNQTVYVLRIYDTRRKGIDYDMLLES